MAGEPILSMNAFDDVEITFHGKRYRFNPQPDMTALESARISQLFLGMMNFQTYMICNIFSPEEIPKRGEHFAASFDEFINKHHLVRHFQELEEGS